MTSGFIPGWQDYVRKEEKVTVFQYNDTSEDRADLLRTFPDNFQIRTTKENDGSTREYFCLCDEGLFVILKPYMFIVRDSCGHFYPYEEEYFDFMFSRPDEPTSAEPLARDYYRITGGNWDDLSKEEQKIEIFNMAKFCRKYLVLRH